MTAVVDKFLRYVAIDTQSNSESKGTPSTEKQFNLAHLLVKELKELGLTDAAVDPHCYVMATLPANTDQKVPVIGLIAHMDTSPDMSGENVKPQIIENYDGSDILLNPEKNIVLSPNDFPELKRFIGQSLVTTDGTTLLGSDDKAGIAEIMTAVEFLQNHPEIKHGTLKIGFTPDEEIGKGANLFDIQKFGADFAYTIDGGDLGEINFENFNAAGARITITGRNVHPGTAKNKMINSIHIGMELAQMLPVNQRPEFTEGYEGFFHLAYFGGRIEETVLGLIIREHDRVKFEKQKQFLKEAVDFINQKYGANTASLTLEDQYYNMKAQIEPVYHIIDMAIAAMRATGIEPKVVAIRGGTDGASLSYLGLPTPNLFSGCMNAHGRFEYVPIPSMEKAVEVILKICELYTTA
ncbi:MAG: peptidase T [Anaerolineaceae bacterium]